MARAHSTLLVHLRRCPSILSTQVTDSDLLAQFTQSQDPAAFELLFWRHGPLVWGVCHRLLGNAPDADDAFQATFVVLARKAASIGKGTALASWLHRVAWRTALNALKGRCRRAAREQRPAGPPEVVDRQDPVRAAVVRELRERIDAELMALPERFRLPVLLCDVEGRSHEAAASELNCPLGTLNSRLARARAKLKARLLRQGLVPAGLAAGPVPAGVASVALQGLYRLPSAPVQALAVSASRALAAALVQKVASAFVICGLLVAGIALAAGPRKDAANEVPPPAAKTDPVEQLRFLDPDAGPLPADALARIGSPKFRHGGAVTDLAYSPDSKWLASISTDRGDATARLWEAATGQEHFRVKVTVSGRSPNDCARALGFSRGARHLLVVDAVSFRALDIATGKEQLAHRFAEDEAVPVNDPKRLIGAAIAPDGKTFVLVWDGTGFEVRDAATGAVRCTGKHPFKNYGHVPVEFSSDSRRFLIAGESLPESPIPMPVFDTASGNEVLGVETWVDQLRFLPGAQGFVALKRKPGDEFKRSVAFIDGKTGKVVRATAADYAVVIVACSPDGKLVAAGSAYKHDVQLIDVASGREVGRLPKSTPGPWTLAFSPDGKWLAGSRPFHGAISVWNVAQRTFHPASAEPTGFYGTTLSSDGRAAILYRMQGWPAVDWRTGKVTGRLDDVVRDINGCAALSPDGKVRAVATFKGPIQLFEAATGQEVRQLLGHASPGAGFLTFSPDGRRLASCGSDKTIRVWDVAAGQEIAQFAPPEICGSDPLSFSHDGRVLAVSFNQNLTGDGNVLYTWDVDAPKQRTRVEAPNWFFTAGVLSPDGRLLVGGGGQYRTAARFKETKTEVLIWDAVTGHVVHALGGHDNNHAVHPGSPCAFAPDGRWLITGDGAGQLRLWEVATGQEVRRFEGHQSRVYWVALSADGRLLVSVSNEAPCLVWDVVGTAKEPLALGDPEQLWRDLADTDAKKAFAAVRRLVANPGAAVELFRKNLKPAAATESARLKKLVSDLDADAFRVREAAAAELGKVAERIEPLLREARASASAEAKTRIDRLLEKAGTPSPERLRQGRSLAALEWMSTPAAARFLGELASGAKGERLTAEAAAGRDRLRRRGAD